MVFSKKFGPQILVDLTKLSCNAGKECRDYSLYIYMYIPRKSKNQTLPIGSRESFTWIILKTILCLVLDFQGIYRYIYIIFCSF